MDLSNSVGDAIETALSPREIDRRWFLKAGAALGVSAILPSVLRSAAVPYRVGVGRSTNAYIATRRAITASGEWPSLGVTGKVVIIKPNLVSATTAASGAVTDPEVVRAIVDLALADGAALILIVEAASLPANAPNFDPAGYSFFASYDSRNRVRLVDLATLPVSHVPVPNGWIYGYIYAAPLVLRRDFVFINVAKLKTHGESVATMTTKNVFGIPYTGQYISTPAAGRFAMHDRGLHQTIVDLNSLRPTDFAVIDGMVGMEGLGPTFGTPVEMNIVLAGRNSVAVDRIGLAAMGIGQNAVRYLNYAALVGMGPSAVDQVTVAGDGFTPRAFQLPATPVNFDPPRPNPSAFSPALGQTTTIQISYYSPSFSRLVEIVRLYDDQPARMDLIRTLIPSSTRGSGTETVIWDGRSDGGTLAPPGTYAVHVRADDTNFLTRHADAIAWITVVWCLEISARD